MQAHQICPAAALPSPTHASPAKAKINANCNSTSPSTLPPKFGVSGSLLPLFNRPAPQPHLSRLTSWPPSPLCPRNSAVFAGNIVVVPAQIIWLFAFFSFSLPPSPSLCSRPMQYSWRSERRGKGGRANRRWERGTPIDTLGHAMLRLGSSLLPRLAGPAVDVVVSSTSQARRAVIPLL